MNETTTTKQNEFVFRRLADSFDQFTGDLWAAVPTWLLALAAIAVVARMVYRVANPASRAPGSKDPTAKALGWAAWLSVAVLVVWVLIAFFNRENNDAAARAANDAAVVSTIGSGNAVKWYSFTIGIFALGSLFVILMYIKDTRSVRWFWAAPLALLRMTVYAILCFVFLLPAVQTWENTNKQSRVVILLDISPSVTKTSDESGGKKMRVDHILDFLTDESVAFIKNLMEKNPVAVYAFGTRLDESPQVLTSGDPAWGRAEWEAFSKYDFKPYALRGLSDDAAAKLKQLPEWGDKPGDADWAATWVAKAKQGNLGQALGIPNEEGEKLAKNLEKLDKRIDVARTIALGTNVADSVTAAVNREAANMVQGIIVFSDGRSNLGSDTGYLELRDRAAREKIPVFTVAVGEDRQKVEIAITEVQAPDSAPIDEAWKVIVEADGKNLAGKEVEVMLDLFKPGNAPPKDDEAVKGNVGTPDFTYTEKLVFAPGDPPHGQAEFTIDPAKLAADPKGKALTTDSKDAAIKKPVLLEGKWAARARIKKDDQETYEYAEHIRTRPDINVVQQKLRILLVTSAPGREFSHLRTMLVREVQDKRAELTTYVQNEAGRANKITKEEGENIIVRFPNRLDLVAKKDAPADDKPYNLNEYDVIVAIDPDWSELSRQQAEDLKRWVQEGGGGLIFVAGSINTYQLARVEDENGALVPLLTVLPVVLEDSVVRSIRPSAKTPRRLKLYPQRITGSELLKLDDKVKDDPVAGWEPFFTDRDKYAEEKDLKKELFPRRGFFSAYPVKSVKPGSATLADFMDVTDTGDPDPVPWIVTNNPSAAYRTAFLGNSELYRLRPYEPDSGTGREYFERFWIKLIKYMAAKRNFKAPRGRVLVGKEGVSGTPLRVQARVLNETAKPYPLEGGGAISPKFKIVQEKPGSDAKREFGPFDLTPKTSAAGTFDGYYAGQVLLDPKLFPPGDFSYRVEVDVPDSADKLSAEFRVKQSNPELDNTRPDFPAMLRMASDFTGDVHTRSPANVQTAFASGLPKEGNVTRLAFKIGDRELLRLIPQCMETKKVQSQNRGPVNDLWDKGIIMPTAEPRSEFVRKYMTSWWSGQRLSIVLLAVVFLLGLEWLIRKLLRLA